MINILMRNYKQSHLRMLRAAQLILLISSFSTVLSKDLNLNTAESILNRSYQIVKSPQITQEALTITFTENKQRTCTIYMSADNDLAQFARKNLVEIVNACQNMGSTKNINIVVQLDTKIAPNQKVTLRYYIAEGNRLILTNANDPASQRMDSGDPNTLIDCCKWAITNFPADEHCLILWNHGIGIIDLERRRFIHPTDLFTFNPSSNMIELDRTIPFLDFITAPMPEEQRGICFDDSTGNFITNQGLDYALKTVTTQFLSGIKKDGTKDNKFSVIAFDACLMSMLEVAKIISPYARYMVASQEVELGTGYNYNKLFEPLTRLNLDEYAFAQHIVQAYGETYARVTNDYTQSALDLSMIHEIEKNVNVVATLLIECIKGQRDNSAKKALRASRHKLLCTHFDEPSYIDLHHLYTNVLNNLSHISLLDAERESQIKAQLKLALEYGRKLITKTVIANQVGKNLSNAKGISIYFPEQRIHTSYRKTSFAHSNAWIHLLGHYILA